LETLHNITCALHAYPLFDIDETANVPYDSNPLDFLLFAGVFRGRPFKDVDKLDTIRHEEAMKMGLSLTIRCSYNKGKPEA
jgi:hypothetical protein